MSHWYDRVVYYSFCELMSCNAWSNATLMTWDRLWCARTPGLILPSSHLSVLLLLRHSGCDGTLTLAFVPNDQQPLLSDLTDHFFACLGSRNKRGQCLHSCRSPVHRETNPNLVRGLIVLKRYVFLTTDIDFLLVCPRSKEEYFSLPTFDTWSDGHWLFSFSLQSGSASIP